MDRCPNTVQIAGAEYQINTDFRAGIELERIMDDWNLSKKERVLKAIELYFNPVPDLRYVEEIIHAIMWFYDAGKTLEVKSKKNNLDNQKYFSYIHDADYIYAAFLQQYGINLQKEHLHWWIFRGLFLGLNDSTEFIKIVGYRAIQITRGMSKTQKEFYRKMKEIYALPASKEEQERKRIIEEALMNGGDLNGITEKFENERKHNQKKS